MISITIEHVATYLVRVLVAELLPKSQVSVNIKKKASE